MIITTVWGKTHSRPRARSIPHLLGWLWCLLHTSRWVWKEGAGPGPILAFDLCLTTCSLQDFSWLREGSIDFWLFLGSLGWFILKDLSPKRERVFLKFIPFLQAQSKMPYIFHWGTNCYHCVSWPSLNKTLWEKNLSFYVSSWMEDLVVRHWRNIGSAPDVVTGTQCFFVKYLCSSIKHFEPLPLRNGCFKMWSS